MKTNIFNKERMKHYDKVFWVIMIGISVLSVLAMYSAISQIAHSAIMHGKSQISPWIKHAIFIVIGLVVAFLVQQIPSKAIRAAGYILLGISVICLLLTFVPGFGVKLNGAARWVRLGSFTFQPSEFAKLSLIIVETDLLSRMNGKDKETRRKLFLIAFSLMVVVCGLILISNFSTAILLALVIFTMMFLARVDWKILVSIIGIAVVVLASGYLYVEHNYIRKGQHMTGALSRAETWVKRVDAHFGENEDLKTIKIDDKNRQRVISMLAIARGGKTPFGVGPGNSLERDYLPLAYEDYIFAIYVEEFGIIGAILLIVLYLTILFRACSSSNRFEDNAAMMMVMGVALMITLQAFVSMAVTVGLGPVTGQPLPLMTRGGTTTILTSVYFGIMMAVSREQNELKAKGDQTAKESREDKPELI